MMRGGAVAARRAHNPEVLGSNPSPATERKPEFIRLWFTLSRSLVPVEGNLSNPSSDQGSLIYLLNFICTPTRIRV
jgi:hypothetical protein